MKNFCDFSQVFLFDDWSVNNFSNSDNDYDNVGGGQQVMKGMCGYSHFFYSF